MNQKQATKSVIAFVLLLAIFASISATYVLLTK